MKTFDVWVEAAEIIRVEDVKSEQEAVEKAKDIFLAIIHTVGVSGALVVK